MIRAFDKGQTDVVARDMFQQAGANRDLDRCVSRAQQEPRGKRQIKGGTQDKLIASVDDQFLGHDIGFGVIRWQGHLPLGHDGLALGIGETGPE